MAATNIMALVGAATYDIPNNQYNVLVFWTDNEGVQGTVDVLFDITETAPIVNARCIAASKTDHNNVLGTNFNVATPSVLFSGMA